MMVCGCAGSGVACSWWMLFVGLDEEVSGWWVRVREEVS